MPDTPTTLPDPDVLDLRVADPALARAVTDVLAQADAGSWSIRLVDRDVTLWSTDPAVQDGIGKRLGWLDAPRHFSDEIPALEGFGEGIRDAGFTTVLVLGMGGSSLAPDVLISAFGDLADWPMVRVLDSTDPAAVRAAWADLDPLATLVIVATKSGTTTETLALQADARQRIKDALHAAHDRRDRPSEQMIAITDPGKSLAAIPHHDELREYFLNPEDVGGRYSALTYVGLVPASLQGLDLDALLASGTEMLARCTATSPAANPGVALGAALGGLAKAGRDKLTLVADPAIARFGTWLEQLIAESTGKLGVGIVPVDAEPLGTAAAYGPDRVFVRLVLADAEPPAPAPDGTAADALLATLAAAGHPVIRIEIADPIDLAGEFVRWEVATAIAGIVLGIDPFDQPNVEEAKQQTRRILAGSNHDDHGAKGYAEAVSAGTVVARGEHIALAGDSGLQVTAGDGSVVGELRLHLDRLHPAGYAAIQAFIAPTPARDAALARIRALLRDATGRATTAGYGPRYLHSTGQLHKGGPAIGWFLQLTADHPDDLPIPGWPYTFGRLIDAQAAGDRAVLEERDLPLLEVRLGPDPDAGLAELETTLAAALGRG
jgi:transaldolase / glucose-6-phosphate isomerase